MILGNATLGHWATSSGTNASSSPPLALPTPTLLSGPFNHVPDTRVVVGLDLGGATQPLLMAPTNYTAAPMHKDEFQQLIIARLVSQSPSYVSYVPMYAGPEAGDLYPHSAVNQPASQSVSGMGCIPLAADHYQCNVLSLPWHAIYCSVDACHCHGHIVPLSLSKARPGHNIH
jgi:hypothetical protein